MYKTIIIALVIIVIMFGVSLWLTAQDDGKELPPIVATYFANLEQYPCGVDVAPVPWCEAATTTPDAVRPPKSQDVTYPPQAAPNRDFSAFLGRINAIFSQRYSPPESLGAAE